MSRLIAGASVLVVALAACTAPTPSAAEAPPAAFEATAPPATAQDAYDVLKSATVFESKHLGYAGVPSTNAKALRALLAGPEPQRAMRALYTEGTLVGKLYAVAGLYLLDDPGFEAAARGLAKRGGRVDTQNGCLGGSEPVAEILFAQGERIVVPRGKTLAEWFAQHPSGAMGDIAGGYIPLDLAEEESALVAPREPLRP
jgi:hypothetical protein